MASGIFLGFIMLVADLRAFDKMTTLPPSLPPSPPLSGKRAPPPSLPRLARLPPRQTYSKMGLWPGLVYRFSHPLLPPLPPSLPSVESEHLQPSSPGWPVFLRVNPILKWDYGLVWRFLRGFNLPYCCLYEEGYTSLGDVRTTIRNPALLKEGGREGGRAGGREGQRYRPAYELVDWTLERANRAVVGEGGGEGGKEKEMVKEKEAVVKSATPTTTTTMTTRVVGEEGVRSGKRKEGASSASVSTPVVGQEKEEEEEEGEGEGEVDDRSQGRQQQQRLSLSPPRHVRRRSNFAERLPVALLCVGDFLSVRVRTSALLPSLSPLPPSLHRRHFFPNSPRRPAGLSHPLSLPPSFPSSLPRTRPPWR